MSAQHILLIEDDPSEAKLAKHHLRKILPDLKITHFTDGRAFLDFCESEPLKGISLAIMDLHMPGQGGIDTLLKIREDQVMLPFPVLIFSSSNQPEEIHQAYAYGASAFVNKPVNHQDYRTTLQHIVDFWLSTNRIG